MQSFQYYFARTLRVQQYLAGSERFLAHLPNQGFIQTLPPPETLPEHADKVLEYAERLCEVHQLDIVVDQLIEAALPDFPNRLELGEWVKEIFVGTIAFHDLGKINPHFQQKQMKNPLFDKRYPILMEPKHAHAALGTYLFLSYYLDKIQHAPQFESLASVWLAAICILLTNSITEHHSPRLRHPGIRIRKTLFGQDWEKWAAFREDYHFPESPLLKKLEDERVQKHFYDQLTKQQSMALFTLVRLNFSLLISADTLATSDYMRQGAIQDFGLIDEALRRHLLEQIRKTTPYNANAFELADDAQWESPDCTEKSPANLNLLRGQMAVEVLRNIRKTLKQNPEARLFYLEAPTGGGKTNLSVLAATEILRLCPEMNKLLYVFPFTTLITQSHRSIAELLGLPEHEIGLLHSKAGFRQRETTQEESQAHYGADWQNDLHLQFMHFPVCLMTHIRFFDLLKSHQKSAIYPMHRLANSIVVLDELQSYPPTEWDKMRFYLEAYSRLFNIRFIIMSATLPHIDRLQGSREQGSKFLDLLPEPRRFFTNPNFRDRVRFRFDLLENSPQPNQKRVIELPELADFLTEQSQKYAEVHQGRVFTMIEFIFKKSATAFKLEIEAHPVAADFFDHIFVLSGTILEPRRREIINFLKREADQTLKILLITTQVVEAGVDIDMDLGFKNISLIDSDEQLAGRINRNVKKPTCEVFLFKVNEPRLLYRQDLRFQVTDEKLDLQLHSEILETKDFERLYQEVLSRIDQLNAMPALENLHNHYLPAVWSLDYPKADKEFQLIDADNLSIFVPMELPIQIAGSKAGIPERLFDDTELQFLEQLQVYQAGAETLSGKAVWEAYRALLKAERDMEFFEKRIGKKIIQGILSKFTFSVFRSDKLEEKLKLFVNAESSLDSYLCLIEHFGQVYSYESGLMEDRLDDTETRIF